MSLWLLGNLWLYCFLCYRWWCGGFFCLWWCGWWWCGWVWWVLLLWLLFLVWILVWGLVWLEICYLYESVWLVFLECWCNFVRLLLFLVCNWWGYCLLVFVCFFWWWYRIWLVFWFYSYVVDFRLWNLFGWLLVGLCGVGMFWWCFCLCCCVSYWLCLVRCLSGLVGFVFWLLVLIDWVVDCCFDRLWFWFWLERLSWVCGWLWVDVVGLKVWFL